MNYLKVFVLILNFFNFLINLLLYFLKVLKNFTYLRNKAFFRFLVFGLLNTLTSYIFLLIIINYIPLVLATLSSSLLHLFLAYFFGVSKIFKKFASPLKFIIFYLIAWLLQWFLLDILLKLGLSKELSIILLIPVLALNSFFLQKKFVFK